ncbi:putative protein kinase RLK-Pelle-RLCK-VIIa-2 family [Medicago truncatula]|uniref:Protein kinase domain-containing protein n=1 Tax=Medicago truncatula TaxID=3880 RepID=A0A396IFW8_MEDTR|nr:putative protein kinase RLK-Pelle-RLCK-VIIa-2 family [Medicago truncatula]
MEMDNNKCGCWSVAVKSLKPDGLQGHREWVAEFDFLGQLHHPNLVKLIGYCIEDDQRLLVYEFMTRGSLENHLFRNDWFWTIMEESQSFSSPKCNLHPVGPWKRYSSFKN